MTHEIEALIVQTSADFQLPLSLLRAQVLVESAGDPNAFRYEPAFFTRYILNNGGAVGAPYGPLAACSFGLLQILLETACEHGFTGHPWDLFVPAIGLTAGARYLRYLLDRTGGDYHVALAQYNGGVTGNRAVPLRNIDYVNKVLEAVSV